MTTFGSLVLALTLAVSTGEAAVPIRVTPVVADERVVVAFTAPGAIGSDAGPVVESGLTLTLAFQVELRKPSRAWFDRTLAAMSVASTIKLDNLTGVYHVSRLRDGHIVWSERTDDFAQARAWATTFDALHLADTTALDPNEDYYVRVRLRTMPRRTFPRWPWASDESSGRTTFTFFR
jgi:hypothetical protein